MAIDLTGGEVKVIGNSEDTHVFRLSNPVDQLVISSDGEYEGEFISHERLVTSPIDIDISQISDGSLFFTVTITSGFYRIRRLNPRRTLLTIEVECK